MACRVCVLGDELGMGDPSYVRVLEECLLGQDVVLENWSKADATATQYIMDDSDSLRQWLEDGAKGVRASAVVIAVGLKDRIEMPEVLEEALQVAVQTVQEAGAVAVLVRLSEDKVEKHVAKSTGALLVETPSRIRRKLAACVQARQPPRLEREDHEELGRAVGGTLAGALGFDAGPAPAEGSSRRGKSSKRGEREPDERLGARGGGLSRSSNGGAFESPEMLGGAVGDMSFDGFWVHKDDPSQMEVIDGNSIRHMATGKATTLTPISMDCFSIKIKGQGEVCAQMIGDELHFQNGDVWTQIEDPDTMPVLSASPLKRSDRAPKGELPAFATLDLNGDGVVSRHEYEAASAAQGLAPEGELPAFATLDLNGDGVVSRQEYEASQRREKPSRSLSSRGAREGSSRGAGEAAKESPLLDALARVERRVDKTQKEEARCWQDLEVLRQTVAAEREEVHAMKRALQDKQSRVQELQQEVSELRIAVQANESMNGGRRCC